MSDMTHKTVPVEPTAEMEAAARAKCHEMKGCIDPVMHVWDAMLSAAPPSPVTELETMRHAALKLASEKTFGFYHVVHDAIDAALAAYSAKKEGV